MATATVQCRLASNAPVAAVRGETSGRRLPSPSAPSAPRFQRAARLILAQARNGDAAPSSSMKAAATALAQAFNHKASRPLAVLAANVIAALPAHADAGKIFDFNATLPAIVLEFLLLMFVLDNLWFKPLSKVLDERDDMIRSKVDGVKDNSSEINKMQNEAAQLLKAARLDAQKTVEDMKKQTEAKLEDEVSKARAKVEKELAAALASLQAEKDKSLKSLDEKVIALSNTIVAKLLPADSP
eukprot:jgi/Chlat1/2660/Chrsp179S02509